jgi:hypothetical protein
MCYTVLDIKIVIKCGRKKIEGGKYVNSDAAGQAADAYCVAD